MPLCTLHLLALTPQTPIATYLSALRAALPPPSRPLLIARPIRWIILPTSTTATELLNPLKSTLPMPTAADAVKNPPQSTAWDLLLILPSPTPLPPTLLADDLVRANFSLSVGIPSRITSTFTSRNPALLAPITKPEFTQGTKAPLYAASAQNLELTPELHTWARDTWGRQSRDTVAGRGPVSMLNLLRFLPGKEAHEKYATYGRAFAESIGSRRGGDAKIVGKVAGGSLGEGKEGAGGWDEVAVAQYPSMAHFVDMAGSEDYQAVNWRERLKALEDTCILMTSEVCEEVAGESTAKL